MGEPPRLSEIQLPWEKSIIYFVTVCVKGRRQVLANTRVFEAIKTTIVQLRRWHVLAGIIMPDHAHWLVSPPRTFRQDAFTGLVLRDNLPERGALGSGILRMRMVVVETGAI